MKRRRVFIAGPMSTSDEPGPNLHAAAAAAAAADLLLAGFDPFIPHVTWILHAIRPDVSTSYWRGWNLRWLATCDAVLRLPGGSVGAADEVSEAASLGIPVFWGIQSLRDHFHDIE